MTDKPVTDVGSLMLGAARIRAEAELEVAQRPVASDFTKANELEESVRDLLPKLYDQKGAGGELIPIDGQYGTPPAQFRDTVEKPDYVTAAASRNRLDLAHDAGVLELAVDTADTIEAENSLEKMLAHQLAAVHRSTMLINGQLNNQIKRMDRTRGNEQSRAIAEVVKLTNSTARLTQTFQNGLITLQKLRNGGRQVVTVQHVNVGHGGQAVVAGAVGRGRGHCNDEIGARQKNER